MINDLSTTSPARASGSASLFLRTAREADVHLNTYTDVRRRRRCSFVSPDRRRSLVVPHGAYVGAHMHGLRVGSLRSAGARCLGRCDVRLAAAAQPLASSCIVAALAVGARLEQEGWRGDAARASVRWLDGLLRPAAPSVLRGPGLSAILSRTQPHSAALCCTLLHSAALCCTLLLSSALSNTRPQSGTVGRAHEHSSMPNEGTL